MPRIYHVRFCLCSLTFSFGKFLFIRRYNFVAAFLSGHSLLFDYIEINTWDVNRNLMTRRSYLLGQKFKLYVVIVVSFGPSVRNLHWLVFPGWNSIGPIGIRGPHPTRNAIADRFFRLQAENRVVLISPARKPLRPLSSRTPDVQWLIRPKVRRRHPRRSRELRVTFQNEGLRFHHESLPINY